MAKTSTQYIAIVKCVQCNTQWKDLPRGPGTTCPNNCGSKRFEWLNYDETFGKHCYTELGEWDETYGKLTGKQIRKMMRGK